MFNSLKRFVCIQLVSRLTSWRCRVLLISRIFSCFCYSPFVALWNLRLRWSSQDEDTEGSRADLVLANTLTAIKLYTREMFKMLTTLVPILIPPRIDTTVLVNNAKNQNAAAVMMSRVVHARCMFWLIECGRKIDVRRSVATNTRRNMKR